MESAIGLRYTPLPTATFRLSSGAIRVRASRSVHLSLSHASLCRLSHCSLLHQAAANVSGRVNCMLDGNERFSVPSKKEGSDSNMIRGITRLSLVMACVLGVFNFSNKMNPKSITAYANLFDFRSKSTPVSTSSGNPYQPVGFDRAEFALDSVLNMIKQSHSKDGTPPQIKEFSAEEINKLKLYAAGLTKSQKPDEALQILTKEYERLTEEEYSEPEAKLNLDMALIEILILQGKYKKALELLDSRINKIIEESGDPNRKLNDDEKIKRVEDYPFEVVSKPKIFLYKAILHTMLGKRDAAKWGKAFGDTI